MLSEAIDRPRREVTFFNRVHYREIPSHRVMTKREKRLLWIDDSESINIEGRRKETLALMDAGVLTGDDKEYCIRGLYTRKENRTKYRRMQKSRDTVLTLQDFQTDDDYLDEEEIALSYMETTYASRIRAQQQGDRDHIESHNYCSDVHPDDNNESSLWDIESSRDPLRSKPSSMCDRVNDSLHRVRPSLIPRL